MLGSESRGLLIGCRQQNPRMRFLVGLRPQRYCAILKMLSFPGKWMRFGPGSRDECDCFSQATVGFAGIDIVCQVFMWHAPHESRDQTPAAHYVEHRILFGDPNGVQHRHEIPDHRESRGCGAMNESGEHSQSNPNCSALAMQSR